MSRGIKGYIDDDVLEVDQLGDALGGVDVPYLDSRFTAADGQVVTGTAQAGGTVELAF